MLKWKIITLIMQAVQFENSIENLSLTNEDIHNDITKSIIH